MTWTLTDYDKLKAAIASGALVVEYENKRVEYRTLKEMREILQMMKQDLGLIKPGAGRRLADFSKGTT